jgi:hypothetical protein
MLAARADGKSVIRIMEGKAGSSRFLQRRSALALSAKKLQHSQKKRPFMRDFSSLGFANLKELCDAGLVLPLSVG